MTIPNLCIIPGVAGPSASLRAMGANERDVIVVGGGHNGLACATYLAKAGLDVLVLERRPILGGAAATEDAWDGYRISSASYVVSLMPDRIVDELELKRHGYEVSIITPDYFVPFPDGTSLTLWGDVERDAKSIAAFNTHDAEAYVAFDAYFERVAGLMKDLLFVVPPNLRLRELASLARTGARFRGWTGRDVHEVVRLFTMSAADFLDEWFEDDRVKGAMATQAIIGAWCGPMTPGSAYVLMHHWIGEIDGHFGAWGWVKGGMGGVSAAMASAAREAGATIRTDAEVARIAISSEGRAVGVELADGSAPPCQARGVQRAPEDHLPRPGRTRTPPGHGGPRHRTLPDTERVGQGQRRAVRASGVPCLGSGRRRPQGPDGGLALDGVPGTRLRRREVREGVAAPLRRGDVPHGARARRTRPARQARDDGLHAVPPVRRTEHRQDPRCLGEEGDRRVGRATRRVCPRRSSTWRCSRRRTSKSGSVSSAATSCRGSSRPTRCSRSDPIPFYGDHRTPIEGLYLCGGGTHPGGGVMGVPGRNASTVVLHDARWSGVTRPAADVVARARDRLGL